jgi:tetratricopeptide (TPR) repeat protein
MVIDSTLAPRNALTQFMSAESSRAVFISYASQDADAARRISAALRTAGIEVWFDQSELRGGDAWDQKIRRQIRECALFVAIISRHTEERLEGYYRLEWKLAVDRSHLMSEAKVFLLPVVIDDIDNTLAKVPDRFRDVQWTRLPGGEPSGEFSLRIRNLLASAPPDGSKTSPGPKSGGRAERTEADRPPISGSRILWAAVAVVAVAMLVIAKPWKQTGGTRSESPAVNSAREPSEALRLAERARRHFQGVFTRADLAQAEELGRRAAELEPTLALTWAVRAGANACYLMRGFVAGEVAQQRARQAQAFAERAIAINRDETEALIALGQVAMFQRATTQAEAYYRRVMQKDPENPFARRYLSIVLRTTNRVGEAIAVMQQSVKQFPRDTLSHFDLALAYAYGWDWPRAWDAATTALAIQPFPGALVLKIRLAFQWKGDVALMRQLLDQLELTYRSEDDAVIWEMRCGLFERKPERVLEAAGRTARIYLEESFIFPAPKAWFTAQAYQMAGKTVLARQEWEMAATVLRERLKTDPQNLELQLKLAVTLAWMKDDENSTLQLKAIEMAWREQLNPERAWDLASFYAASGNARSAVPLLRQALHAGTGIAPLTLQQLKLDPWWDPIVTRPSSPLCCATLRRCPRRRQVNPKNTAVILTAPQPPAPLLDIHRRGCQQRLGSRNSSPKKWRPSSNLGRGIGALVPA